MPPRQHLQVHGAKSAGVPGGSRAPPGVRERGGDQGEQEPPPPALGKPVQDTLDLPLCGFLARRCHPHAGVASGTDLAGAVGAQRSRPTGGMEADHAGPPDRCALSSPPVREIFLLKVKVTYGKHWGKDLAVPV